MSGNSFDVPVLDVSRYVAGGDAATDPDCARVAAALDRACREVGFVQIVGHGIDTAALTDLSDALDEFFALPLAVKKQYRRDPAANRGYSPPKSESLSMSLGIGANQLHDYYEAFTVGTERASFPGLDLPEASYAPNNWPDAAAGFRPRIERYFAEAQQLARTLMTAVTDALALPRHYFDPMTDHCIEVLKMNNFALPEGDTEITGEFQGMGAHTDFGILTILWADQVPGLQVLGRDGSWHDVAPADGALLINLGDAMARWTNDRWMSTVHRVDPPVVNGRIRRRRSAAFFFDGNHDAVLEALPGTLADGEVGYEPITVAENIAMKVAGLRAGVAPQATLREAARVAAAAE